MSDNHQHIFEYIHNLPNCWRGIQPKNSVPARVKLEEIKNCLQKGTDIQEIIKCLKSFDECREYCTGSSYLDKREMNFVLRISKWLLMNADESVRNDPRVIREYTNILDFGICQDNLQFYLFKQPSAFLQFPPKNIQVWKETVNYCLSLIELVDTEESGMAIVYALRGFINKDESIKERVRENRDKLIEMMIRLTRFPSNQTLLKNTQALMVYWTLNLLELSGAKKWDGRIEQKTVLDKFQGFYLKNLVDTLPKDLRDRFFSKTVTDPNEVITEIFNVVNSLYLKNGDKVATICDNFLRDNCLSKFKASTILNLLDRPEIDEFVIHSIVRYLKFDAEKSVCKRISSAIFNLFNKYPHQHISELNYSITDLYFTLSKCFKHSFEQYCDYFENEETQVLISNTILAPILEKYMEIRTSNDNLQFQKTIDCFDTFGKSTTIIDRKYLTFIMDFGDNSTSIYSNFHSGGYCQVFSVFESLANNFQNRGSEIMKIMDNEMCHRFEKLLEYSVYRYNDPGWFAVLCSALESGFFWKLVEKSRQLSNPNFTMTEKFRQGYTMEMAKLFRQNHEGATQDPSFKTLYFIWFLLMENIEKSKFSRGKKDKLYLEIVNLSLIERDYDCGNAYDSPLAFLLLAELEDNVDEHMNIILEQIDKIVGSVFEQGHRATSFIEWTTRRLLENLEKFLYHFQDSTKLSAATKNSLKQCVICLPGHHYHPELLKKLTALLD